jgi:hypothetical protein
MEDRHADTERLVDLSADRRDVKGSIVGNAIDNDAEIIRRRRMVKSDLPRMGQN